MTLKKRRSMNNSIEELIELSPSLPILDSFVITKNKVDRYNKILVSVSGGWDSDIMVDIFSKLDIEKKCTYVFINTGIEYQATKEHIKCIEKKYGIKIKELKATTPVPLGVKKYGVPFLTKRCSEMIDRLQKHNFKWEDKPYSELIKEYPNCKSALRWWCNENSNPNGKKSQLNINKHKLLKEFMVANPPTFKISAKCCDGAKKNPAKKMCKLNNFDLQCLGIRKLENGIRSQQYKNCFTPGDELDNYRPIFWYSDEDKRLYDESFNVEHSDCYKKWGMNRTGCAGCPFGSCFEDELKIIEKYEPKLFKAVNNIFCDSYEYTRKYRDFKENGGNK